MVRPDSITEREYRRLTEIIRSETGIVFPQAKWTMIETRLGRRARALGVADLSAYCQHLESPEGKRSETPYLVDAVTTHKTDFFREPAHFDYLAGQVVEELARHEGAGIRRPLLVWSAACSTGEEPYSVAMVLAGYAASVAPRPYRFRVEASDVSAVVLETARRAVYPESLIAPVPEPLRRRYILRSKDRGQAIVRIAPEIRACVFYRLLNLMDRDYGFREPLDVVFCRNVMIYFDREAQQQILSRIVDTLRPGGYLIMGHAESLTGVSLPLVQVTPTIYRRCDA